MSTSTWRRRSKSNGLVEVLAGAELDRFDGAVDRGVAGHQDHFAARHGCADLAQQVEAVHVGHAQVDHREIGRSAHQGAHRLGAARARDDVEADLGRQPFDDLQDRQLVVDDEQERAVQRRLVQRGYPRHFTARRTSVGEYMPSSPQAARRAPAFAARRSPKRTGGRPGRSRTALGYVRLRPVWCAPTVRSAHRRHALRSASHELSARRGSTARDSTGGRDGGAAACCALPVRPGHRHRLLAVLSLKGQTRAVPIVGPAVPQPDNRPAALVPLPSTDPRLYSGLPMTVHLAHVCPAKSDPKLISV